MRISDWSSDVCSSDLGRPLVSVLRHRPSCREPRLCRPHCDGGRPGAGLRDRACDLRPASRARPVAPAGRQRRSLHEPLGQRPPRLRLRNRGAVAPGALARRNLAPTTEPGDIEGMDSRCAFGRMAIGDLLILMLSSPPGPPEALAPVDARKQTKVEYLLQL